MSLLITLLIMVVLFAAVTGAIQILYVAFVDKFWWGLGCLFLPGFIYVYGLLNFSRCKRGVILLHGGSVLTLLLWWIWRSLEPLPAAALS